MLTVVCYDGGVLVRCSKAQLVEGAYSTRQIKHFRYSVSRHVAETG